MFGGSFDMNFHTSSSKMSYDYNTSTFDGFGVAVGPKDLPLASESNTTFAVIGLSVSTTVGETNPSPQESIATQQGSTVPHVVQEKTNAGLFSSFWGSKPNASSTLAENQMGTPGQFIPLACLKTSVSHPLGSKITPAAGLSRFAQKRVASAPSQEVKIANASA
jgi:hypothetical protein